MTYYRIDTAHGEELVTMEDIDTLDANPDRTEEEEETLTAWNQQATYELRY